MRGLTDWWLVAFKISGTSGQYSSSGTTRSSSSSSSTDIFSIDRLMASGGTGSSSTESTSSTSAANGSVKGNSGAQASTNATNTSAASDSEASADAPAKDSSAASSAAAGNSQTGAAATKGATKGRSPARGTGSKTAASQTPNATAASAEDVANAGGLSILQLLARSLDGESSAPIPADSTDTTPAAPEKSADGSGTSSSTDPNAIALQLLSQALAAALGGAVPTQITSSGGATAATDDAATAIADATKAAGGSSTQDLVMLLAQDAATNSTNKTDAALQQLNAPETKSASADNGTNSAAAGPNSLVQMGIASHFSPQHLQSDTPATPGELRSAVGTAAWNDELGGQLTWMTHQGIDSGSLKLSPEHLGPVEVTISVQDGSASVWFGANQADTRAALEQALPRLREMFASQGLALTDSGVSRESPRNSPKTPTPQGISAVAGIGGADASGSAAVRISLGLVDTYA
jgi:flagellar hook-length control protein FliK